MRRRGINSLPRALNPLILALLRRNHVHFMQVYAKQPLSLATGGIILAMAMKQSKA